MKEKVVLFGASTRGRIAFNALKDQYDISYFCDNDKNKWGSTVNGVEVVPPDQLKSLDNTKVIITSMYDKEISNQLDSMGIHPYKTV
ncbi:MAG: hypothetical protein N2645_13710 [Clostridia bacterium]|nr:hypothetical protein [Clostridia bacterium]